MAKVTSKNAVLLIGGYLLSPYGLSYTTNGPRVEAVDVTGFGDATQNFIPGQNVGDITLNMYWDNAADSVNSALSGLGNKAVTVIPEGYSLGADAISLWAMQENFSPKADTKSAITVESVKFSATGDYHSVMEGQMLTHATITNTTTSTGVRDWGAADLTTPCAAVLHIYTPCAADTYAVTVEHSTDNTNWSTLATFTANGSSRTSEIKPVVSGALGQYRRVVATRTGAAGNSFGFAVFFWRL